MKTIKKLFQEVLLLVPWLFKIFVKKHRLNEAIVDKMIQKEKAQLLAEYIKYHHLSNYQITSILATEPKSPEMLMICQELLKNNILDEKQQVLLTEKNNAIFYENYLCPEGYFEINRRFKGRAEEVYLWNMCSSEKMIGYEIFKTYVDNCRRDLMTETLLADVIKFNTRALHYLLYKVKMNKVLEEYLVKNAPVDIIKIYIDGHELSSDQAMLCLVEKHYELAKLYNSKYGLRSLAQHRFHELRKQAIAEKQEKETVS